MKLAKERNTLSVLDEILIKAGNIQCQIFYFIQGFYTELTDLIELIDFYDIGETNVVAFLCLSNLLGIIVRKRKQNEVVYGSTVEDVQNSFIVNVQVYTFIFINFSINMV